LTPFGKIIQEDMSIVAEEIQNFKLAFELS